MTLRRTTTPTPSRTTPSRTTPPPAATSGRPGRPGRGRPGLGRPGPGRGGLGRGGRLGLAALAAVGLGCGLVGSAVATGDEPWVPPDDTIVGIEGDQANGFTIHRYDGSQISPPTDSEARAECGEYDRRIDRVRCRVEVRTWYRDLAETRDAIRYARADAAAQVAEAAARAADRAADRVRARAADG